MQRAPWSILLLAVAVRWLVCAATEVPGRDGATYLWMAQTFAGGDPGALFQTVFHPLYPALIGMVLWLWPGLDPEVAGQLVAAGLGAAAVLPLWAAAAAMFGSAPAAVAALAYATGAWFARHPAECMSEGPFFLCAASWAWALVSPRTRTDALGVALRRRRSEGQPTPGGKPDSSPSGPESAARSGSHTQGISCARTRPLLAGLAAGLAFLLRPEGASMLLVGVLVLGARRQWRAALQLAAVALPLMLVLPLGFAVFGDGFTLTPKALFNYDVGVGSSAAPWWHYLREAAVLPLAALEEVGWLWLPLAVAGLVRHWRSRPGGPALATPAAVLLLPFLLQCVVTPLLFSHWRFLAGYGVLLLPFAGAASVDLWHALGRRHRVLPWLLPVLLAAAEARVFGGRNQGRAIERDLGRYLGARLEPGEFVVSDMPRLDYFAGQKPPPPRPIRPADVLARAAEPGCRFVALVQGRTEVDDAALAELGLEPLPPPPILSEPAGHRGVRLFSRSRTR